MYIGKLFYIPFITLICLYKQHWHTIAKPELVELWPEKGWAHAGSIITGSILPILVVIGGLDKDDKIMKDFWILDISKRSWTKVCHDVSLYFHIEKYMFA